MKKLIILCIACVSLNVAAQQGVRIGNLEIIVKKTTNDQDTTVQQTGIRYSSTDKTRQKPDKSKYKYHTSSFFSGIGCILPDNGSGYYTVLGGNSINIDAGWMHRYQIARRFALGTTFQYSFYNYKLKDAAENQEFMDEITGKPFADRDINKQVYRTHNISAGLFTRFYVVPPKGRRNNDGIYADLGVQGDFLFSKYYKLKTRSEGKARYHNDYAFNPFTASAIARIGRNCCAVFVRYRFTDSFNSKALPMDLPPVTIGIQFF